MFSSSFRHKLFGWRHDYLLCRKNWYVHRAALPVCLQRKPAEHSHKISLQCRQLHRGVHRSVAKNQLKSVVSHGSSLCGSSSALNAYEARYTCYLSQGLYDSGEYISFSVLPYIPTPPPGFIVAKADFSQTCGPTVDTQSAWRPNVSVCLCFATFMCNIHTRSHMFTDTYWNSFRDSGLLFKAVLKLQR